MIMSNEMGPINLGNPNNEISVNQLISIFETLLNKKFEIIYQNLPENDPTKRNPDITIANNMLNWNPTINIYDGVRKFIDEQLLQLRVIDK